MNFLFLAAIHPVRLSLSPSCQAYLRFLRMSQTLRAAALTITLHEKEIQCRMSI